MRWKGELMHRIKPAFLLCALIASPLAGQFVRLPMDSLLHPTFTGWNSFLLDNQRVFTAGVMPRKASSLVLNHTHKSRGLRNTTAKRMQVDRPYVDQFYLELIVVRGQQRP